MSGFERCDSQKGGDAALPIRTGWHSAIPTLRGRHRVSIVRPRTLTCRSLALRVVLPPPNPGQKAGSVRQVDCPIGHHQLGPVELGERGTQT